MKIKRIEFMEEIRDENNDNVDVCVENEDGYNYIVTVGTPQDLLEEMNQEKTNFVRPGSLMIIVKKLTKEIVTEAIQAYAENDAYWLKLHHFAIDIDMSIFNKLEVEHRKEWEFEKDLVSRSFNFLIFILGLAILLILFSINTIKY